MVFIVKKYIQKYTYSSLMAEKYMFTNRENEDYIKKYSITKINYYLKGQ